MLPPDGAPQRASRSDIIMLEKQILNPTEPGRLLRKTRVHSRQSTSRNRRHSNVLTMSLTSYFIASLLSQEKHHLYSLLDPNFKPPRVQVTSLHSNPNMMRFQEILKNSGVNVPVVSLQGVQWMTVSDGKLHYFCDT